MLAPRLSVAASLIAFVSGQRRVNSARTVKVAGFGGFLENVCERRSPEGPHVTLCFVESLPRKKRYVSRSAARWASCRCYRVEIMLLVPLWQSWWLSELARKGSPAGLLEKENLLVLFFIPCWGILTRDINRHRFI